MSNIQVIILIIVAVIVVLAIWNLYLGLQNRKIDKIKEEKRDYYGRLK